MSPTRTYHEYALGTLFLDDLRPVDSNGLQKNILTPAQHVHKTRSAPISEDHDIAERQELLWSRIGLVLREPFAELWGVFIMVLFEDGSVA
jgi:hypothetical protein